MKQNEGLHPDTLAITSGRPMPAPDAPLNTPISLSATLHAGGPLGYGRYGNETWSALEDAIGALEGGPTLVFSSGLAAIGAVFSLLPVGSVVTASDQGYSGSMALLRSLEEAGKIEVRYVTVSDTEQILAALPGTALVWLESPTNPCLEIADLPAIIREAKSLDCGVAVDNTFATPLNQRPLQMGADIVAHSVTKYLAGHSDVLMGSLSTSDSGLFGRLENARKLGGAIAGPFEAWLALRGLRTFPLRFERAQANAMEIAQRLAAHPMVESVNYPGLATDPFHDRARSFMDGFGAVLSFTLFATPEQTDKVCEASKVVMYATSLGGVESLWERRRRWSGESSSVSESLIRLSVGCEYVEDLWSDIENSLQSISQ
ncbi:MAG: aminotransferase class I/II-fold pyridoxal phosphate-dependent enzyme [Actinobacteria bacterium]|nr:aminotransferase class I/II-fold pyridoxal phosphate-dependent enzyme [Actinomycetota bacterium]